MRHVNTPVHFVLITHFLKSRVGFSNLGACTSDSDSKVRSKSNVTPSNDSKLKNLGPRSRGLGCSSSNSSLIDSRRSLRQVYLVMHFKLYCIQTHRDNAKVTHFEIRYSAGTSRHAQIDWRTHCCT